MPVMDGYEVVKHIRKAETETNTHVVIIALTASAFDEERAIILDSGCDDFILKPYKIFDIYMMLARHLQIDYTINQTDKTEIETNDLSQEDWSDILKDMPEKFLENKKNLLKC